ncbi:glycosyltransferase family 2 protein [Plectonema cf. radiosum LEGE 06105]|uniref:Glycosyltransferase family 2 protein n=1 Tax=Plectonema cf. radiosum LEGE 06105 TaxID=945769 RepID=A0A8J7F5N0_9CYAN|nr:glycosyltransferase family 2 protein [Plectonema radiosum]MBE9211789.1 glycosyltransferase family 2 protein [Plectonema cf. radiosum LEGE 06105]
MTDNYCHNQPLVSVIIPTYNRPEYLKLALISAVQQTYQNIEIIVSDNCSYENPQSIIESFADSRIRFFRNESNLGMLVNTMNAFKKARGKYVASLLDDDIWEKDFLAKLVPPLEANSNLALAFCDHYVIKADGTIDIAATQKCSQFYKRVDLKEGIYQPFYKLSLIDRAVSSATAAVIRREIIDWDSIPAEVGGSWDIYLNYLCCRSGNGAYYYPAKLTRYREHEQTDTMLSGRRNFQAKIRKAKADLFCYEQFLKDDRLKELHPYFQKQWGYISTNLGIGLMRGENLREARISFWHSLRQHFSLRTIAALILSFIPPKIAAKF